MFYISIIIIEFRALNVLRQTRPRVLMVIVNNWTHKSKDSVNIVKFICTLKMGQFYGL